VLFHVSVEMIVQIRSHPVLKLVLAILIPKKHRVNIFDLILP